MPSQERDILDLSAKVEQLNRSVSELEVQILEAATSLRLAGELFMHTEDFATGKRGRGIRMVNSVNTDILGFMGMRNNAKGDLVLGIQEMSVTSNYTYVSFSNNENGELIFRLSGFHAAKLVEYDTRLEWALTKPTSKNLSVGMTTYAMGIFDDDPDDFKIVSTGNVDDYATQGVLSVDGRTAPLHFTVNPIQRDIDFYVASDTTSDTLKVDAGNDQVSVGGFFNLKLGSELTIASGVITVANSFHSMDTSGDATTDIVHTVSGGQQEGNIILLKIANDARDVTIDENGNVLIDDAATVQLGTTADTFMARWDAGRSKWCQIYKASP